MKTLKNILKCGIIIKMMRRKNFSKIYVQGLWIIWVLFPILSPLSTYALVMDLPTSETGVVPSISPTTQSPESTSEELWSEKIEQLLDFTRRIYPPSSSPDGFPNFLNTTQPSTSSSLLTQNLITITTPSHSRTFPVSIQETDSHYVIHLPLYGDSGEVTPLEIRVARNGVQEENGVLTIPELRISGASFQNLVINTENHSLVSGEMIFDDGTTIKIENGAISEYRSPRIKDMKELLSSIKDSNGQPYYTPGTEEDPTALTDELREAYLRFQYDLLMGNVSSDSLPQEELSCVLSDGQNSITITPTLLAQLEENGVIEYSPDGKYQLSVSINGLEIPYPLRFNFKNEQDFSKLQSAVEKGILDNGYINLRVRTPQGEYDLKVPFTFLLADLLSRDNLPLHGELKTAVQDIYLFINDYLQDKSTQSGPFTMEYNSDQNLFQIYLPRCEITQMEQYFNTFNPVSTALIPGINNSGILAQMESIMNQDLGDRGTNEIYHRLFTEAHDEVQLLLRQLHQAIQNGNLEDGYAVLEKINEILGTTMERAQFTSICIGYIQKIQTIQELASKSKALAAPDELALYTMKLNDVLESIRNGNWNEAYKKFADLISLREWHLQPDGTISELERILSQVKDIAGRELAIERAVEFIAMSILSVTGGQLLGTAMRALIEKWGWLSNLVTTIGATRAGRIGGALLRTIFRTGNYLDELSEAGISSGGNLLNLLLAAGGRPGALLAQKFLSTMTGYALRMGLNAGLVGTATYYTTVDENNRFWQFINNPIGFLFPSTESVGNLGDICEFVDLVISAYNGHPVSVPGIEVETYRTQNPVNIREVFARATQSLATFNQWLTSQGFVPGLTIEIVSNPKEQQFLEEIQEQFTQKQLTLTRDMQERLLYVFNRFYNKFGGEYLEEIKNLIINYTQYLLNTNQPILTAQFNQLLNNLEAKDMEVIQRYNSIVERINNVFSDENAGGYSSEFDSIRKHLLKMATSILEVYAGKMDIYLDEYPGLDEFSGEHKEIASRALMDLNFILKYLETKDNQGMTVKVSNNGSRLNVYIENFDSQQYGYDDELTARIIPYVKAFLSPNNIRDREWWIKRLSFRFDFVENENAVQLDITSPYLYMALALRGDHAAYHGHIIPGAGEEEFNKFIQFIRRVLGL